MTGGQSLRRMLVVAAVAAVLWAGCAARGTTGADTLTGRWKAVASTIHLSDGTTHHGGGDLECWLDFSEQRVVSECRSRDGTVRTVNRYHRVAPRRYEAEVIENKLLPALIGTRSTVELRVEKGRIFTTAFPPPPPGPWARYAVKVQATWVRD